MKGKELEEVFKEKLINYEVNQLPPYLWDKIIYHDRMISYARKQFLKKSSYIAFPIITILTILSYILLTDRPKNENRIIISPIETISTTSPASSVSPTSSVSSVSPTSSISSVSPTSSVSSISPASPVSSTVSVSPTSPTNLVSPTFSITPIDSVSPTSSITPIDSTSPASPIFQEPDDFEIFPQEKRDTLFIPSLFTPNGDGVNDIFLVYSPKTITEFDMIITNRAGVVLFRSKDINIGWDGANASQDIYFYVIIFKDSYDRKQIRKGIINLIR